MGYQSHGLTQHIRAGYWQLDMLVLLIDLLYWRLDTVVVSPLSLCVVVYTCMAMFRKFYILVNTCVERERQTDRQVGLHTPKLVCLLHAITIYSAATIESIDVQDRYGNDTLVAHQVLKRVWPSTQRDIVFLSALRELPPRSPDEHGFGYVVCNFSVEHPSAPVRLPLFSLSNGHLPA